jgi:hypothetical protein
MRCHTELVVRELASGRQWVWPIAAGGSVRGLQLSPDATRLVYLLDRGDGGDSRLHLLPLGGRGCATGPLEAFWSASTWRPGRWC